MKITLSGIAGTGTTSVGKMLAKELDYEFKSGSNMFRMAAIEEGLTMEEADVKWGKDKGIDLKIDNFQKKFGEENDNFVLDSKMAWYCVPDGINIKFTCNLEERIRRVTESSLDTRLAYNKDGFEKTKEKTLDREINHQSRILDVYGIENIYDDSHFDLIIDTTNITPEKVVSRILEYINKQEKDI